MTIAVVVMKVVYIVKKAVTVKVMKVYKVKVKAVEKNRRQKVKRKEGKREKEYKNYLVHQAVIAIVVSNGRKGKEY